MRSLSIPTVCALLASAAPASAQDHHKPGMPAAKPLGHPDKKADTPGSSHGHQPGHGAMKASAEQMARTQWSAHRRFRVAYEPLEDPVPLNAVHAWKLSVTDPGGRPVTGARIEVDGGMPAHDHGLPTAPKVASMGGGAYRIEGMKFHMRGAWVVKLNIAAAGQRDAVTFHVMLE